jgi:CheY-like chemotaxis protein
MIQKKILLAEDDKDDQDLFLSFLKHRQDIHLLPIAENGVSVLKYLNNIHGEGHLPDMIILDQNMPKMTGMQALKAIKEDHRFSDIPVMIYSTYTDQHLTETSTKMGATVVINKPFTKQAYNDMIDKFINIVANNQ